MLIALALGGFIGAALLLQFASLNSSSPAPQVAHSDDPGARTMTEPRGELGTAEPIELGAVDTAHSSRASSDSTLADAKLERAGSAGSARLPSRRERSRMKSWERRQYFDHSAARAAGLNQEETDRLYEKWKAAEESIQAKFTLEAESGGRAHPDPRSYDEALREFLDDEEFDEVLYATGEFNRVHIREPRPGRRPPVDGLFPGDIIEAYDGEPVYRLTSLQRMIKQTAQGDIIEVVVRRDGQLVRVDVPGQDILGPKSPYWTRPLQR